MTIAPKASHQIPVNIPANGTLEFSFTIQEPGLDIGFQLRDCTAAMVDGENGVLAWQGILPAEGAKVPRYGAAEEVKGAYQSDVARTVELVWDNSPSWFRQKTLSFSVATFVEGDEEEDEEEGDEEEGGAAAAPGGEGAAAGAVAAAEGAEDGA